MNSHTQKLNGEQVESLRKILQGRGFEFFQKPYAIFAAKQPGLVVVAYEKGPKVLVQGKGTKEFVEFTLEPEVTGEATLGYEEIHHPEMFQAHFGVDESGKGDFFGPLVIAGVFSDQQIARRLLKAGVTDSKAVTSRKKIAELADFIREESGARYSVVSIGPESYNRLYAKMKNLNRLLAWGHVKVMAELSALVPDCRVALSDQFAKAWVLESALKRKGLAIDLQQRTKAEDDLAVAAASILARDRFVDWIERASAASKITLPLGATAAVVKAGQKIVTKFGEEKLQQVAKMHFKTTEKVLAT